MNVNASEKETRAMFLNFKELRCLEKSMLTLDLERAYSMSLITLDQKVLKVRYKRLMERVSRIKSHLPSDEIETLKHLDQEGKLGVTKSASKMDFNLRIEAASKRLKLLPRSKSAVPRLLNNDSARSKINVRRTPLINFANISNDDSSNYPVPRSVRNERRNSIVVRSPEDLLTPTNGATKANTPIDRQIMSAADGNQLKPSFIKTDAFMHEPSQTDGAGNKESTPEMLNSNPTTPRKGEPKQESVSFLQVPDQTQGKSSSSKPTNDFRIRPVSVPATQVTDFTKLPVTARRGKSVQSAQEFRRKSIADTNAATQMLREGRTRSLFSSHELKEAEKKSKLDRPFRSIRDGIMANIEPDSMENNIGSDLYKDIKKGMLLGEVATNLILEDKIDRFAEKIENYVNNNPTDFNQSEIVIKQQTASVNKEIKSGKKLKPRRNKLRRRQLEIQLEDNTENQKEKSDQVWKDINQCRYLRIPDELIDLSGIKTLAVDQMRMFNQLRTAEYDDSD